MPSYDPHALAVALAHGALLVVGARLIAVDIAEHRLPDRIVLPALGATLLLVLGDAVCTGETAAMGRGLAGMIGLCAFYALLRGVSRGGMGGGDVKLAAVIGLVLAWHGWSALVIGAAAAFALGALSALALLLARRADGATMIAFGPWMILGAVLGIGLG
ncbi:hypothetical protein GCM10025768_20120 [Microbacterium pseudoresistens]|uniref:Leader peptidase (Prepilin peptidase)/N-methyltransferase n=1 Tax=Microbacterium pseudoresistens TaxID=640634 RepID=A0A7Y9EXQ9_9MICO|nr:prepilin peptidase [Microbacterium pseudoresistens]NYD55706.1 leader peptidase (prepilin peptidase)/N-methyltransferase [Microbacterium pseudoresistens]